MDTVDEAPPVHPARHARARRWRPWMLVVAGLLLLLAALLLDVWLKYVPAARALRHAQNELRSAQQLMTRAADDPTHAPWDEAEARLRAAAGDLGARSQVLDDGWLAGLAAHLPWAGDQVRGARALRRLGQSGVDLAQVALPSLRTLVAADAPGTPLQRLVEVAVSEQPQLHRASDDVAAARTALAELGGLSLAGPLERARRTAVAEGSGLVAGARTALIALAALPEAAGPTPRRYLLLLCNPGEQRPGGGFIGEVGDLVVQDGRVLSSRFRDSYFADHLVGDVPAPRALDRYMFGGHPWTLEDANWSPDFPTSARDVARFYTEATGQRVDGVIAVDPVSLSYVLKVLGPVQVPGYPQVITADNTLRELNLIANGVRSSDPGKDFLGGFGRVVLDRVTHASSGRLRGLLDALRRGVHEKRVVVAALDVPALAEAAAATNADGRLARVGTGDQVFVDDANISAGKNDLFVRRRYRLDVVLDGDRTRSVLTLTFANPVLSDPQDRALVSSLGGTYRDYVRVFVPADADVDAVNLDGKPVFADEVGVQAGLRYIGYPVQVPPGRTATLTVGYSRQASAGRWSLRWIKQVNALSWPISLHVTGVRGKVRNWQSQLDTDRNFRF